MSKDKDVKKTRRKKILERIKALLGWTTDMNRTPAEREAAAGIVEQLQRRHKIRDEEVSALHSPTGDSAPMIVTLRSQFHLDLAAMCAALFGAVAFFESARGRGKGEWGRATFEGSVGQTVQAQWLFNSLDEQLEQRNPFKKPEGERPRQDSYEFSIGGMGFSFFGSGMGSIKSPLREKDYHATAMMFLCERLHAVHLERKRRQDEAAQSQTCTALVPYVFTGAQLKMEGLIERVRAEARAATEEPQPAAPEAPPPGQEPPKTEEAGDDSNVLFHIRDGEQAGREIRIPLEVTLEGGIVQRSQAQVEAAQREKFIAAYVRRMGGTAENAGQVYDELKATTPSEGLASSIHNIMQEAHAYGHPGTARDRNPWGEPAGSTWPRGGGMEGAERKSADRVPGSGQPARSGVERVAGQQGHVHHGQRDDLGTSRRSRKRRGTGAVQQHAVPGAAGRAGVGPDNAADPRGLRADSVGDTGGPAGGQRGHRPPGAGVQDDKPGAGPEQAGMYNPRCRAAGVPRRPELPQCPICLKTADWTQQDVRYEGDVTMHRGCADHFNELRRKNLARIEGGKLKLGGSPKPKTPGMKTIDLRRTDQRSAATDQRQGRICGLCHDPISESSLSFAREVEGQIHHRACADQAEENLRHPGPPATPSRD